MPLPRLTYGMEITLDDIGLQVLVKYTGLPPVNFVAWINARPAIGVSNAVLDEVRDPGQYQPILEHFVTQRLAYYERRHALLELIRRNQNPTSRRMTLESHDLRFAEGRRHRINFVSGGRLHGTRTRSDDDIERAITETKRAARQYLKRILDHKQVYLIQTYRGLPPFENEKGKLRIGVAFPTAYTYQPMAVTDLDHSSEQALASDACPGPRLMDDASEWSWWNDAREGHLPDRVTKVEQRMFDDMYCHVQEERAKLEQMVSRINERLREHRLVITQVPETAFQIISEAHDDYFPEWLEYDYRQNEEPTRGNPTPKGLLKVSPWIEFPPTRTIYRGCWERYSRWINVRYAMMERILRTACGGFAVFHNGQYWPMIDPANRRQQTPKDYRRDPLPTDNFAAISWRPSDGILSPIRPVLNEWWTRREMQPPQRILRSLDEATEELERLLGMQTDI